MNALRNTDFEEPGPVDAKKHAALKIQLMAARMLCAQMLDVPCKLAMRDLLRQLDETLGGGCASERGVS